MTKLLVPPGRPQVVPRPQLAHRLTSGLYRKFSLISAPAGFGKTTSTREWAMSIGLPIAWLSLESVDRPTWRLLSYLIASIRTLHPGFATELLQLLASSDHHVIESYLGLLVNEISRISEKFLLVLDDVHLVDTPENTQLLGFLIDHIPATCHLVLVSRETPDLPLPRYRMRDQVTEIGMNELKFSPSEAGEFFTDVMGIALEEEESATLVEKTEGWVSGLQAAALSMRQSGGLPASISAFSSVNRNIVRFLEEDVLNHQPDSVRAFLLQVSIVEVLCGSLCDALTNTEAPEGESALIALDKANLFLIPLDSHGRWYRIHHLFRETLQQCLQRESPDQIGLLHLSASRWYRDHEDWPSAAKHAVTSEDFGEAAACLERAWEEMSNAWSGERWRQWVASLPEGVVRSHPVLSAQVAHAALGTGDFAESGRRLQDSEAGLSDSGGPASAQVPNPDLYASLPAAIAIGRAYLAQAFGDTATTLTWTERVLVASADPVRRMQAAGLQGLAHWSLGNLELARRVYAQNLLDTAESGSLTDTLSLSFVLADITIGLGRLTDAERICQQALDRVQGPPSPYTSGLEDIHRLLAEIAMERGQIDSANDHLARAEAAGEVSLQMGWRQRYLLTKALLEACSGEHDAGQLRLDEAEREYYRTPLPELRPLYAVRARLFLMAGRNGDAIRTMEQEESVAQSSIEYPDAYAALTRVRVLQASDRPGDSERAGTLLAQWEERTEESGNTRTLMEIALLQALHLQQRSAGKAARRSLERAMDLAAPEGHKQLFLNERSAMSRLIRHMPRAGLRTVFSRQLRRELMATSPTLDSTLSVRELEVLGLMAKGLSNAEIGTTLFVALDTVKGHGRRIFQKLGVRRRTEAVAEARERGLLE